MIVKFPTFPPHWERDTFLKGILEGKCTQTVTNGPAHIARAGAENSLGRNVGGHPQGRGQCQSQ